MAQVTVTEVKETVTDVDPATDWAAYKPRSAVKAALFLAGADIDGVHIPGGFYAVFLEGGIVRAVDPEVFELVYASA